MSSESVFVRDGHRYLATDQALGPWSPDALHGGAPAALLVHEFERCEPAAGLGLARVTYEFLRPVPVGPLEVGVEVVRPGRRVTLLDGTIRDPGGTEVARARALRVAASELGRSDPEPPPFAGPAEGRPSDFAGLGFSSGFATRAMEIRFVEGEFARPGKATAWFRLTVPLVAGEQTSPFELAAAAGDFGNGIASELSWGEHVFINPDLTLQFEREPRGEWVALQSQTRISPGSVAVAESVLYDQQGRFGRATQALVVGRR